MQLIADEVVRPDGSKGEQFWVNFKTPAVLIFPMDNEGNIYLTDEHTYATNRRSIEAAGGSAKENESIEDAARREVKEELGLEVDSLLNMGTEYSITSRVFNETHLIFAKVASVGDASLEKDEDIRLKKVPFSEAYEMALRGEINTSAVRAGIFQIKLFLDAWSHPMKIVE